MKIGNKIRKKLADGSSIAIPCVFSADATEAGIGIVVVVDNRGGVVILGVVGCEDISSSYNNKDDVDLSNFRSTRKIKYELDEHKGKLYLKKKRLKLVTDEW